MRKQTICVFLYLSFINASQMPVKNPPSLRFILSKYFYTRLQKEEDGAKQRLLRNIGILPAEMQEYFSSLSTIFSTVRAWGRHFQDFGLMLSLAVDQDAPLSVLKDLVASGANPNEYLNRAISQQHVAMVEKLLQAGASANIPGMLGLRPLHYAVYAVAQESRVARLQLLLEYGAMIDETSSQCAGLGQLTPLAEACRHLGNQAVLKFLLDHGANINAQDAQGWTPLMHSLRYWCTNEYVHLLLQYKADAMIRAKDGRTVLDLAKARRKTLPETISLLEKYEQQHTKRLSLKRKSDDL